MQEDNGCWNCKHFDYEDTDGFGICQAFDAIAYCGDDPCKLWEERKVGNTD